MQILGARTPCPLAYAPDMQTIYTEYTYVSLSPFQGSFFTWTWVSQYPRMSQFWILLELRMMEVVVTTGDIRRAKLQSSRHHQQTKHPAFHRPDALPVAQPTVPQHWREMNIHTHIKYSRWHRKTGIRFWEHNLWKLCIRTEYGHEVLWPSWFTSQINIAIKSNIKTLYFMHKARTTQVCRALPLRSISKTTQQLLLLLLLLLLPPPPPPPPPAPPPPPPPPLLLKQDYCPQSTPG